jgi:hypothetical protein
MVLIAIVPPAIAPHNKNTPIISQNIYQILDHSLILESLYQLRISIPNPAKNKIPKKRLANKVRSVLAVTMSIIPLS